MGTKRSRRFYTNDYSALIHTIDVKSSAKIQKIIKIYNDYFVDPLGLALERNDLKIIEIEETKHMSADIEDQHSFTVFELGKR